MRKKRDKKAVFYLFFGLPKSLTFVLSKTTYHHVSIQSFHP